MTRVFGIGGAGRWKKALVPGAILVVVCGVWVLLSQVAAWPGRQGLVFLGPDGVLSFLEQRTIDARFAMRGDLPSPLKVAYVDVDADAVQAFGNFPWNRMIFAAVIDAMFQRGGVKGIGFDFLFSDAGLPNLGRQEAMEGSVALGQSVQRHADSVVLAASYSSGLGVMGDRGGFPFVFHAEFDAEEGDLPELPAYPVLGPTWGRVGLIDVMGDDVREIPVFAQALGQTYLTMALQLALVYQGLPSTAVEIGSDAVVMQEADGGVVREVPLMMGQFVEPNWFSPWYSAQNPRASVVTVIEFARMAEEGTPEEKAQAAEFFEAFKDAIVLVGPTDPMLKDMAFAPLNGESPVPRVSLHGNLLKTIVSGRFIWRPAVWMNVLLIVLLGGVISGLAILPREILTWGKYAAVLLMLGYIGMAFWAFARWDLLIPMVAPLGAALSCTLFAVVVRLSSEEIRRRRIRSLFGSYVSASVVDEIVEKEGMPQTGGEAIEITAFFSDIVSFSSLSEKLDPRELVALMCEYLGEGTAAISGAGGTLDKFVGDAIVAMFGSPLRMEHHAAAACHAALTMQAAQKELRWRWSMRSDGGWPPEVLRMRTRIGLNTGYAVVGNIGCGLRFNYTMMGSEVNLAQRMEAAVGHFGSEILVTEATKNAALKHDSMLVFRPLDRIQVAGHLEPVEVYDLLGCGEDAVKANAARVAAYGCARDFYLAGDWEMAADAIMEAARHEPGILQKNPCVVMAERCEMFARRGEGRVECFRIGK